MTKCASKHCRGKAKTKLIGKEATLSVCGNHILWALSTLQTYAGETLSICGILLPEESILRLVR